MKKVAFHPSKNNFSLNSVLPNSNRKAWWQCEVDPEHEWQAPISSITRGHGCPYCCGKRVTKINSIRTMMPHLISEFHPTKNGLSPDQISYASNKKVWWQCKASHEWQTSPGNRYRGTGCPGCSGKDFSEAHSLGVKCPHLIEEWHPTKNLPKTPYTVRARTKEQVWWQCRAGHEWQASTGNRYMGTGCPECAGRKVSSVHNLATKSSHLVGEWHLTKNGLLTPNEFTPKSGKKVWWQCKVKADHEWLATINARVSGQGCPYCANRRISKDNNLAIKFSDLIKEWDPVKNYPLTPYDVTPGSKKKIWWQCTVRGHSWQAPVHTRTKGHGCPQCSPGTSYLEIRICCELKYIFSDVEWRKKIKGREVDIFITALPLAIEVDAKYWHGESRAEADMKKFILIKSEGIEFLRVTDDRSSLEGSHNIIYYKKNDDRHEIIARILRFIINKFDLKPVFLEKITSYLKAKTLKNEKEYLSTISTLPGPKIEDSIASNLTLLSEWDYKKNDVPPEQFSYGSKEKVWWICKERHQWQAAIGSRSGGHPAKGAVGRSCPFCSGKIASPTNNLLISSPALAAEWHPTKNGLLMPSKFTPKSSKKMWWQCKKGHEWQATISNRAQGTKCPDCSGKKLSSFHNLAVKFPHLLKEWDQEKNTPLTPYHVTPKSFLEVWWKCSKGHSWQARVEKRTRGRGCHYCSGYKM